MCSADSMSSLPPVQEVVRTQLPGRQGYLGMCSFPPPCPPSPQRVLALSSSSLCPQCSALSRHGADRKL